MSFTFLLPAATAALIAAYFVTLPQEKTVRADGGEGPSRLGPWFIAALTAVYALAAFLNLGSTRSPQSFRTCDGDSVLLELEEPQRVTRAMVFVGIRPSGSNYYQNGEVTLEFSSDGELWIPAASLEINHASLLKWQELDLAEAPTFPIRFVRLTGWDEIELGELALRGADGTPLACRSTEPTLCDEPETVPERPTFFNSSYFDEIYHARTAWEHLRNLHPYEITHPPLGKLILSLGILLFGMTPFGWRFMGTLAGVLMLPVMYWFTRRLFGGRKVPACCALLLATDFMHFTQTRIATIDSYAVLFILLMYGFMYGFLKDGRLRDLGLAGLFFGLGAACKWTCLYAGAGLGVLWLWYWIAQRRETRIPKNAPKKKREQLEEARAALPGRFAKNVLFCLGFFVALPALIYYLSYFRYGTAWGYPLFSADYTRMVLDNQSYMLHYHAGTNQPHPYSSVWYQWLLDIRPILFYLDYYPAGMRTSFGSWLNPVLCWGGLIAVVLLGYYAIARRARQAAFLLAAYLFQLLPWLAVGRTLYEYHYFPSSVFLAPAIGYFLRFSIRSGPKGERRAYWLCGLSAALFVLFFPALSGIPVNERIASALLKWFPSWPF
ncbi:MAG: glycosyltransferase family 39 protein [Oscillospiraceae bacterium]|nr:glycosyltransferase family 39 protein [Oscillospiraceae bacterium]